MECGSFMRPNMTFGFVLKRVERAAQNVARASVVAALGSEGEPMMEPEFGCSLGSL
jgi:hypothetical protein